MALTFVSFLLALVRAVPALAAAYEELQRREREAQAAQRLKAKDAAVDQAISAPRP